MRITLAILFLLASMLVSRAEEPKANYVPKEGYVPTAEVAIRIAVAIWEPIYGTEQMAKEKPYRATLANGVWTVQGSLPGTGPGGVAMAEISRADGHILRVIHGK